MKETCWDFDLIRKTVEALEFWILQKKKGWFPKSTMQPQSWMMIVVQLKMEATQVFERTVMLKQKVENGS